tara:strand:+ start:621 stop:809 length:189 start_codon:yes stop_codon:yes gene_type:complete
MKCSLCDGEIEKFRSPDGVVYWDEGHNAEPLSNGRCCGICNTTKVIPARIFMMREQTDAENA